MAFLPCALLAAARFQRATNYWYSLPRAALAMLAYPGLPCQAPSVRNPEPIRDGLILAASREGEDAGLNGLERAAKLGRSDKCPACRCDNRNGCRCVHESWRVKTRKMGNALLPR